MVEDHYLTLIRTRYTVGGGSIMIWQHFLSLVDFNKCRKELKLRAHIAVMCWRGPIDSFQVPFIKILPPS